MKRVEHKEYKYTETVKVKYVAFDGTEFDREYECRAYEDKVNMDMLLNTVPNCKEAKDMPPLGGCDAEDHSFLWFRPNRISHLKMIEKVCRLDEGYLDSTDLGKWICIEFGYDGDAWASYLECDIEYMKRLLGHLGYDVTITEKIGNFGS